MKEAIRNKLTKNEFTLRNRQINQNLLCKGILTNPGKQQLIMNPKSHIYQVYSPLRNTKLPNISANYETLNQELPSPQRVKSHSFQNSSSLILGSYQSALKGQIQPSEIREHFKRQKHKHKTLEAAYVEHKQAKHVDSCLSSQLEAIKYSLRSLSMERESKIQKKQKMLFLRSHMESQALHHLQHVQQFMPHPNSPPMQYVYNPYHNHQIAYSNHHVHNHHFYTPQSNYPSSYVRGRGQKFRSQPNIVESSKHKPYLEKPNIVKKPSLPSKADNSKKHSHYSNFSESVLVQPNTLTQQKPKKEFNRTQFKKRLNDMHRYNNRYNNIRKMVKCFWAVYFCICIKKQTLKIIQQRKQFFEAFWPTEFVNFLQTFRDYFYKRCFPFFKLLKEKQFTNLLPGEDDTTIIKQSKKKTFKQLLKIFFSCLKQIKEIENLGKAAWGFCSNGCFVGKGVLTRVELELLCFNQSNGTLLMDENLQKSQIITFVLLKMILFKFILNADKKWPNEFNKQKNQTLTQNLRLMVSFLYKIMIHTQKFYLSQVNKQSFPLNNYEGVKAKNKSINLQFSTPLMFMTGKPENKVISGLHSEEFLKDKLRIKKTEPYVQAVREVVEAIHKVMRDYDSKFRAKAKKIAKGIEYKY